MAMACVVYCSMQLVLELSINKHSILLHVTFPALVFRVAKESLLDKQGP